MIPLLERLTSPRVAGERAQALQAERPLIIMSRGKSGTRLLTWACQGLGFAMGASEKVQTADLDDRRFRQAIKKLAQRSLHITHSSQVDPNDLRWFQREALRIRDKLLAGGGALHGWGWKWPETYLIGPYLHATFPQARYLHLVRDGRDLAFKTHLTDDPRRKLGRALLGHIGALGQPRYLQAAQSWAFQVARYRALCEEIPPENNLEMRYEALCEDPMREMQRVADFMGVPMNDACRTYVKESVSEGEIGQYRGADPAKISQVEAAIGPELRAWGYLP